MSANLGAELGLNRVSQIDQNLAQNPSQNRAQNPSQNRAQIRPALGLMRGQPGRQHKRDLRCAYANSARDRRPRTIPLLVMIREMGLGAQRQFRSQRPTIARSCASAPGVLNNVLLLAGQSYNSFPRRRQECAARGKALSALVVRVYCCRKSSFGADFMPNAIQMHENIMIS